MNKVEEQFNLIATNYDSGRRRFIPCFDDYYGEATDFLAYLGIQPQRIIDLGAGTGLLTSFWYRYFPKAEYILVDIAEEMLKIAKERFKGLDNVSYQVLDYSERLPENHADAIISALSIHHLEHEEKKKLFKNIYEKLSPGGLFVNYDQFCAGSPGMSSWFDGYWKKHISEAGFTPEEIAMWQERSKLDRECSVNEEIEMIKEAGFKMVDCIYSNRKFAVVAAVKI